jgi:gamma-glutamyltranspeptidase/glutathione hydrolase
MDSGFIYQNRRWNGATRYDCVAPNGMVASKHRLISEAGIRALKRGGNAVDAAVAAAFMDCVVEPGMNGIGGEGVMTIHLESGENVVIDYVGRPPAASSTDMYEVDDGSEPGWMGWRKIKDDANVNGYKACVVPGVVAGLTQALSEYGTMKLDEVIKPAIDKAKDGFVVGWWTANHIFRKMEAFWKYEEWRKIYLRDGRFPYLPYTKEMVSPHVLKNPQLSKSLASIAVGGPEVFYKGWIAGEIAKDMAENGGLITREDMAAYEPITVKPEPGSYRGHEVVYDPTHSGTTMMQILNIMEGYDFSGMPYGSPEALHIVSEAIGLAFADRFKYMGDPGWVDVPQRGMTSKGYAEELRKKINPSKAGAVEPGDPWPYESEETTALTVADKDGNMVAVNQTNVNSFGSGIVIPNTGILMNNAMYGLNPRPGTANSIDGRKRRIQNVCPVIVLKDGEAYMALGAPGGRNIQISVAQAIHHVIDYGMGIQDAVDAPRVSRETDTVYLDSRFPGETYKRMVEMGHDVSYVDPEVKSWGRPVGVLRGSDGMLHGGVYSMLTGFGSAAVGC